MGTYTRYHAHREWHYSTPQQRRFYKRMHRRMVRRQPIMIE